MVAIAISGVGAALGQSIARAAMCSKRNYRLLLLDVDEAARFIFPDIEFAPGAHVNDPGYFDKITTLLAKKRIDLYISGSEREMIVLALRKAEFQKMSGAILAISSVEALDKGMDKLKTSRLLEAAGLPFPETRTLDGDFEDVRNFARRLHYPLIVKSRRSGPPFVVKNEQDLHYHYLNYKGAVLQEFLGDDGAPEYTVGLFHTPEHSVIGSFCIERMLHYGLTWRGEYKPNPAVEEVSTAAVKALNPTGSVNVQLRLHKGQPVIHEINVRCSSSTVFRAMAGWNEIDMAVDYFVLGKRPEVPETIIAGRAVRYFSERWIAI